MGGGLGERSPPRKRAENAFPGVEVRDSLTGIFFPWAGAFWAWPFLRVLPCSYTMGAKQNPKQHFVFTKLVHIKDGELLSTSNEAKLRREPFLF